MAINVTRRTRRAARGAQRLERRRLRASQQESRQTARAARRTQRQANRAEYRTQQAARAAGRFEDLQPLAAGPVVETPAAALAADVAARTADGRMLGQTPRRFGLGLNLTPQQRSRFRRGVVGDRLLGTLARRAVQRDVTLEDLAGATGFAPALLAGVFARRGRYGRALSRL